MNPKKQSGFTLIEVIVGAAVFGIIAVSFYFSINLIINTVEISRRKTVATNLANEQMEIIRSLPYAEIGVANGNPAGDIPANQTRTIDNLNYAIDTYISYVDDPYDGTFGGEPHDEYSADYKRVRISVCWQGLVCNNPSVLISDFSSPSAETAEGTGVMQINVQDDAGSGIEGARVNITRVDPSVYIDALTNGGGILNQPSLDPSFNDYHVIATKEGYGTAYTSPVSADLDPNNPDKSIIEGELTEVTLFIDLLSSLTVSTVESSTGQPIGDVDFEITGLRKILGLDGEENDVYKYQQTHVTNAEGILNLNNIEGDFYQFALTNEDATSYSIAGFSSPGQLPDPITTVDIPSGSTPSINIYLDTFTPQNVLFTVRNDSGLLIEAADIRLYNSSGYDETRATTNFGQEFFRELTAGNYNYSISKDGYQTSTGTIEVVDQEQPEIILTES
ncbi:carboxypeptidase regulatory-like domain-containing protein [Patescibacteria group bacterium]